MGIQTYLKASEINIYVLYIFRAQLWNVCIALINVLNGTENIRKGLAQVIFLLHGDISLNRWNYWSRCRNLWHNWNTFRLHSSWLSCQLIAFLNKRTSARTLKTGEETGGKKKSNGGEKKYIPSSLQVCQQSWTVHSGQPSSHQQCQPQPCYLLVMGSLHCGAKEIKYM